MVLGAAYMAVCAVFALCGQLLMELHGGASEIDDAFDLRHLGLAISALVLLASSIFAIGKLRAGAAGPRDGHRIVKLASSGLPFRGRGPWFATLTTLVTFGIGALAHVGEHGASTLHDAVGWLVIALLVAVVGAFLTRFIVRALPTIASAVLLLLAVACGTPCRSRYDIHDRIATNGLRRHPPPPLLSRPPPLQA